MNNEKKRSALSWIWEFADKHRTMLVLSVFVAILGVACGMLPYFFMGDIVKALLFDISDIKVYLTPLIIIAVLWLGKSLFHAISTCISHKTTFTILGNIRKRICEKLSRLPLGYVLDTPSGALKNVIVERIDSIETTMAHVIPEFTSNLLVPIGLLAYLFVLDWRWRLRPSEQYLLVSLRFLP